MWLQRFWTSSIGAKATMAITGTVLYGFAIVHMLGNLNVFMGLEAMNDYGAVLHTIPELLWVARLVLLSCIGLHIASYVLLYRRTAAARPVAYAKKANKASTLYGRSMKISGFTFLIYIVIHLLNLTAGVWHPGGEFLMQEGGHAPDAFRNLTSLLSVPWMALIYIVCNVQLGFHLWHGSFSLFKTLGLSGERHLGLARTVSWGLSTAVAGGNVLIVLWILTGLWK